MNSSHRDFQRCQQVVHPKLNINTILRVLSHAKGGYSVIDVKRSKPGFWRSLYQHKYDGYGYTAYTAKNKYKPSNSSAKVTATKIGPNVNISLRNSDWSLLTSSRTVATDSAKYSSRKYAQANFDDLRIQWLSNLAVSFKVESKLSFSNAGSSTTTTSVLF
uniref:Unknown n=1 Tax=Halalkalibacterium halodurans TaxID=86665 RepID=Q9RC79_ALKHA|nr:unnamed protein product [Halalkalibacterium halodurans]